MDREKPTPFLTDLNGQEHRLEAESLVIGRAIESDVVIASSRVSREHARLSRRGRRWFLEDLGSTNGTFLNDERVLATVELRDGDVLSFGGVGFTFHDPDVTSRETPFPRLEIDLPSGVVRLNRRIITLSPKEFLLLGYLFQRRGEICSKDDIGRVVWPEYEAGGIFDYQIENLVRRLRTHIEIDPTAPQLLVTVRGLGYKLIISP
jgi:DNA-binding response OmpR family regulator